MTKLELCLKIEHFCNLNKNSVTFHGLKWYLQHIWIWHIRIHGMILHKRIIYKIAVIRGTRQYV